MAYQKFTRCLTDFKIWRLSLIIFGLSLITVYQIEKSHLKHVLLTLSDELIAIEKISENRMDQMGNGDFLYKNYTKRHINATDAEHEAFNDQINFHLNSKCFFVDTEKLKLGNLSTATVTLTQIDQLNLEFKLRLLAYCFGINELAGLRNDFSLIERAVFFAVQINHINTFINKTHAANVDENWLMFTKLAPKQAISRDSFQLMQFGKERHDNITSHIVANKTLLQEVDTYFFFTSLHSLFTSFNLYEFDEFEPYAYNLRHKLDDVTLNHNWVTLFCLVTLAISFVLAIGLSKMIKHYAAFFIIHKKLDETGYCTITQGKKDKDIRFGRSNLMTKKEESQADIVLYNECYRAVPRLEDARFCKINIYNREYKLIVIFPTHSNVGATDKTALLVHDNHISKAILAYEKTYKFDQLTGLPNRAEVGELLLDVKYEPRRYLFAVIDLDHFKSINDNFGHHFGDLVLKSYAEFLQNNFKVNRNDRLIRLGGEEFLALIELTPEIEFDKIAKSMATRFNAFNKEKVSASVGIMEWHTDEQGFDQIFPQVDALLYKAKQTGRRRVCYLNSSGKEVYVTTS